MTVWLTRADEIVGLGDLVALDLMADADAVGRIVAVERDGKIQCLLVRGGYARPGLLVAVEEDQLLLRVHA